MDFFSHDIEAARRALYRDFERGEIPKAAWSDIERHFLKGFKRGWQQVQEHPKEPATDSLILQYLKTGIDPSLLIQNTEKNSENFGFALGVFTGTLRPWPRKILDNPGLHRPFMKILEQKPEYYEFVRRIIDEVANL
ncbi:hypothetical protein HYX08_02865 [Candidatus Woesearchaeota archaeon]|nr:hypothetical protein [Candidatus Woesearchaeota archaeon]